jgi:hypothetical protein
VRCLRLLLPMRSEETMFGIAAVVAFAVALILQLASVDKGVLLNPGAFTIIGLLCLAVHLAWPYTPWHRPPP